MLGKMNYWYFAIAEFIILAPSTWFRSISFWNKFHVAADIITFVVLIVILVYAFIRGHDNVKNYGKFIADGSAPGESKPFINTSSFVSFIGAAIFAFEGIGITCPVMDETKNKKSYACVTGIVIVMIACLYFAFGLINYMVYTDQELDDAPLITNALNEGSWIVSIVVLGYVLVIYVNYTLNLYPANTIIESYTTMRMKPGWLRFWLINLSRSIVVGLTIVIGIAAEARVGKLVSIMGSLAATPMAFVLPCGFHMTLVAKNWC